MLCPRPASAGALLALGLAGCDPAASIHVHTALAPMPRASCIDSTLANLPLAVRGLVTVKPGSVLVRGTRLYDLSFASSAARTAAARLDVNVAGDSVTALAVDFVWLGRLDAMPDSTRAAYARQAATLLHVLHDACAPMAPIAIECDQHELGGHEPHCAPPAA